VVWYEVFEYASRNNQSAPVGMIRKTCYGRLEFILECCTHNRDSGVPAFVPTRHLLAFITGCKIPGNPYATHEMVTYTDMSVAPHVINLAAVGEFIGRFHVCGTSPRRAITDWSGELVITRTFSLVENWTFLSVNFLKLAYRLGLSQALIFLLYATNSSCSIKWLSCWCAKLDLALLRAVN
jgi:hypothetical protein